jgi:hypothetical protein
MSQHTKIKLTAKQDPYEEIAKLNPGTYTFIQPGGKVKILTKCGKSNVEQNHRTEIKKMVADAESRGLLRASVKFEGTLDDFPDYDFQEAQMMMADANSKFEQLPSGLREKFGNNPAKFMDYVNKTDEQGLRDIGLQVTVHDGKKADGTSIAAEPAPQAQAQPVSEPQQQPAPQVPKQP